MCVVDRLGTFVAPNAHEKWVDTRNSPKWRPIGPAVCG